MPAWFELPLPWYEVAIRLTTALLCAGIVGFDREQRGHAAGLRTHMMIGLGAATFAMAGMFVYQIIEPRNGGAAPGDPLRTMSAVVGGVGFLGAGAIIHYRGMVRGLTTAAGMWTVAAIGVACGTGLLSLAIICTVLAFVTLTILRKIEPSITATRSDENDAEVSAEPRRPVD